MPAARAPGTSPHLLAPRPAPASKRGLTNLTVLTADLVDFVPPSPGTYDRVVSIECFEHMKVGEGWLVLRFSRFREGCFVTGRARAASATESLSPVALLPFHL